MKNLIFNVKENSIHDFLGLKEDENQRHSIQNTVSAYHLMKDEIFILKDKIGKEKQIQFQLKDRASNSHTILVNTYLYDVLEYDSIKIKLKLVSFTVDLEK